jgi:transcriptional regulator with XRE-family HTH domain
MTGHELKVLRLSRGLSRPRLAELAGIHPDTVKYWERQERVDVYGYAPARMLGAMKVKARHTRKMVSWTKHNEGINRPIRALASWGLIKYRRDEDSKYSEQSACLHSEVLRSENKKGTTVQS